MFSEEQKDETIQPSMVEETQQQDVNETPVTDEIKEETEKSAADETPDIEEDASETQLPEVNASANDEVETTSTEKTDEEVASTGSATGDDTSTGLGTEEVASTGSATEEIDLAGAVNEEADELVESDLGEEKTYEIEGAVLEETDYSAMTKEQLVELVENVSKQEDLQEAFRVAKDVKTYLERMISEEQEQALAAFLDAGNEKDDFAPKPDEFRQRFFEAYKKIQTRRADNRNRLEEEKLKNLQTKRTILEKLKEVTENDETSESLDRVKELQNEWKKIRAVPKENMQELWDSYRFYLDKFYDNLSINNELKELDRKKNLEIKIDLCMKVDQLQEETSINKALNMLNKYHDEWKHTGPVPREYSEEIWARFKAASDKLFEQKKALLDELNAQRNQNLELKTALVEKLEMALAALPDKPKDWIEKTQTINEYFEEWKKVGPVPNEHNETIWKKFKDLRNNFFRQKNLFFKSLNKVKTDNLALKYDICEKAEALKDSDDWMKTTNELIRLQNEWKKIGPVPEKTSDEVWKRFRSACDTFFQRKEEAFKGQKEDQQQSLEVKRGLIEQLKALGSKEDVEQVMTELKEIQKTWSNAGFVPIKFKNEIQNEFSTLVDALYKKFRRNTEVMKEGKMKEHYGEIAQSDEGKKRLQSEERKIREKIRFLKSDIETLENNIGFFSNSKTAGPLIAGITEKIKKTNQQVMNLEKELMVIKKML